LTFLAGVAVGFAAVREYARPRYVEVTVRVELDGTELAESVRRHLIRDSRRGGGLGFQ
jgi:hypothetical protein